MSGRQTGKQFDHQIKRVAAHADHDVVKPGFAQGFLHIGMRQKCRAFEIGPGRGTKQNVDADRCVVVVKINVIGFDQIGQATFGKDFLEFRAGRQNGFDQIRAFFRINAALQADAVNIAVKLHDFKQAHQFDLQFINRIEARTDIVDPFCRRVIGDITGPLDFVVHLVGQTPWQIGRIGQFDMVDKFRQRQFQVFVIAVTVFFIAGFDSKDRSVFQAIKQVVGDGAVKQIGVIADIGQTLPECGCRKVFGIAVAELDAATGRGQ